MKLSLENPSAGFGVFRVYLLMLDPNVLYTPHACTFSLTRPFIYTGFNTRISEKNIFLKNLETCLEKQPIDSANQPIDILQQEELPKEWRIPRDLSVENIIGQIKEFFTRRTISN